MVVAADSIRESTTVTGTGPATLLGATDFARGFSNASVFNARPVAGIPYRIDAVDGAALTAGQCEQGIGTLQSDGTFARTSPTWSKSGGSVSDGAACNFLSGTKSLSVVASFDSVTSLDAAVTDGAAATLSNHASATDPHGDRAYTDSAIAGLLLPRRVTVVVDFGASFTDKASTVVTGLSWVTTSHILTPILRPVDEVDELRLLDLKPFITNVIAGVGFTLSVVSEPEARGQYTFLVVGV